MEIINIPDLNGMRIKSATDLDSIISQIQWARYITSSMENYRGHSLRRYKLVPGICRNNNSAEELADIEKELCENFVSGVKKGVIGSVREPFTDEIAAEIRNYWYFIFQAQHLGLKTRFMDWSINMETALFFAVEDEKCHGQDGSLWIFLCPNENLIDAGDSLHDVYPLEYNESVMINSPLYLFDNVYDILGEKRMGLQHGRFWVQPLDKSIVPLNEQREFSQYIAEIIVDGGSKAAIKKELAGKGYSKEVLYFREDELIEKNIKQINSPYFI